MAASQPTSEFFPLTAVMGGRHFVLRSALEDYKRALIRKASGGFAAPVAPPAAPDTLVPLKIAAQELGVSRRWIGRRMLEAQRARQAQPAEPA
jgi:hypothetical protein